MDELEAMPETTENVNYTIYHFIYGFLTLLGICILFSLGKVIYHYYKVRVQTTVGETTDSISTEIYTVSNELSVSDRQTEDNGPDTDRLRIQLDKLRRLLNRLNAMGTFSRDTIGDLSAQSAACANNSRAASSDLSAFWSSIDFDDFEESTINEGKLQKTLTEKSVSPSLSDISLDTSGIPFDNVNHKNFATSSRENILCSSKTNHQTRPSDAIVQILTILDSIMLKNRSDLRRQDDENTSKIDRNSYESKNISSRAMHLVKSFESHMPTISSSLSIDKNISIERKSPNYDMEMNTPANKESESVNSGTKLVGNAMIPKSKFLKQFSNIIQSQYEIPSAFLMESNMSKGKSVANITSSTEQKSLYATKFSSSCKSLNNKISVSQSVSVSLNQAKCLSNQAKGISKSSSAMSENCHLTKSDAKVLSKTQNTEKISQFKIDVGDMNRSHSLSNLINEKSGILSLPTDIAKSYSSEKEQAISYKSQTVIAVGECFQNSKKYPQNYNSILKNDKNTNERTPNSSNKPNSSISTKSLPTHTFADAVTIKLSNSESEIKQTQYLGVLSPCVSSSSLELFLSPVITADLSPFQEVDWKSPEEPISNNYISQNLTPHNENALLSRKSCIWSTPPSPKDNFSDEAVIII